MALVLPSVRTRPCRHRCWQWACATTPSPTSTTPVVVIVPPLSVAQQVVVPHEDSPFVARATLVCIATEGHWWTWHMTQSLEGDRRISGHSQLYNT